jgi:hypothetical protein
MQLILRNTVIYIISFVHVIKITQSLSTKTFGTREIPLIHNILDQATKWNCHYHLVVNKLSSESFHSSISPITLENFKITTVHYNFEIYNSKTSVSLLPLKMRGINCRIIIIYGKKINYSIVAAIFNNDIQNLSFKRIDYDLNLQGATYVILISSKSLQYFQTNEEQYNHIYHAAIHYPNYFEVLFLPEKYNSENNYTYTICVMPQQGSDPLFENFLCIPKQPILSLWSLKIPRCWIDYGQLIINESPFYQPHYQSYIKRLILHSLNNTYDFPFIKDQCSMDSYIVFDLQLTISGYQSIPSQISTVTKSFQILTCYSDPQLNFYMYIKPFQPLVWLCLALMLFLLSTATSFYIRKKHPNLHFHAYFYFLGSIFEDTSSAPKVLNKDGIFRFFVSPWCLVSTVMISIYLGLCITSLNAPLKGRNIDTFEDAACLNG